jgi:hypothetical protein
MRRNWHCVLFFALALAIQAFSPAVASFAMAQASADNRSFTEICFQSGDGSAGSGQAPNQSDRHHDACALCQTCCSGVSPLQARPNPVGEAPFQWSALAWTVADRALPAPCHEYSHQARAPPAFS